MNRALNFNAGPAALPEWVLKEAQKELLNFRGTGMSVMELSHRSKEYEAVHKKQNHHYVHYLLFLSHMKFSFYKVEQAFNFQ